MYEKATRITHPNALIADTKDLFGVRADNEVYLSSFDLFQKVLFH